MSEETVPRLFAWACCDCGNSEKATIPLHNKVEGRRVIQAICLECLDVRVQRRKEEAGKV